MNLFMRLGCLACLACMPGLPATWSGWLVASRCYSSVENNRSEQPSYVNWDTMGAIRYCSPNYKTKSFAIVGQSGLSFKLDPTGNEKAMSLLQNTAQRTTYTANVKGELNRHTIKVDAISVEKRRGH